MKGIVTIVLAAASAIAAATPPPPPGLASLAAAEREFAASGSRDGVQKSFLAHFAADGIVLKPFAASGVEWYRTHQDGAGKLIWGPQYLAVSAAGDLGLSIGPWRYEAEKVGKPVRADGHFFSVWRRGDDGRWRVAFDHGVGHAAPAAAVEATPLVSLPVRTDGHAPMAEIASRRSALAAADDALRDRLKADAVSGYGTLPRPETVWLREGAVPLQSVTPPPAAATGARAACGCGPRAAIGIATSGDLGYTIGGAAAERDKGVDARVWRFDAGHGWILLADLTAPVD